jgi:hypothetical protein
MSEEKFVKVLAMFVDYATDVKGAKPENAEEVAKVFLKNIASIESAYDAGMASVKG